MMSSRSDACLTLDEVARRLGCSCAHVSELIEEGKLRARRTGSCRRVLAAELEEFERQDNRAREQAFQEYTELSYELFEDEYR